MNRLLVLALAAVTLASAALVVGTSSMLPDPVATHFAMGGRANGWMSRGGYTLFALAFNVLLPWLVFVVAGVASTRYPRLLGMRNVGYWLEPPRRDATVAALRGFAAATALLLALLSAAMHVALLEANAKAPPRLAEGPFFAALALFVAGVLGIVIVYARRFPRHP